LSSQKIKVLVFEENHFEVLRVYTKIFLSIEDKVDFHLVTTKEIFKWYNQEELPTGIIFSDNYARSNLAKIILTYINFNTIPIFLYNTILIGDYQFAGELLKGIKKNTECKVILTIHNINGLFSPKLLHKNIQLSYNSIKNYLARVNAIHPNVDAYNVLCTNQLNYLQSKTKIQKPIFYTPPCIIGEKIISIPNAKRDLLTIAIPGGIEEKRKSYETVINTLKHDKSILPRLKLIILGAYNNSYGRMICTELRNLEKCGLSLWISDNDSSPIHESDFKRLAESTDIFLCPIKEETSYEDTIEYYGKSKSSGSFYDIVRYNKPAIFPKNICIPNEVVECTLSYTGEEELSFLIKKLLIDKSVLDNLNLKVSHLSQFFSSNKVSDELYENLKSLV